MEHITAIIVVLYLYVCFEAVVVLTSKYLDVGPIPDSERQPIEPLTVIICALLPNEETTLVCAVETSLKETAFHKDNQVIVSVIATKDSASIRRIEVLASLHPNLLLLLGHKVIGKYAQLNQAVAKVKNKRVYFLDADQRPLPGVLNEVGRSPLTTEVWQGTTIPRNQDSLLEMVVSAETLIKYSVSLNYRQLGFGNVYFCGSNAVWPTSVLTEIGFNGISLVEDVEASVRTVLAGYVFESKPWLLATELAPRSIPSWWIQRRRWAKGWLDIGHYHFFDLACSDLTVLSKFDWFYLIYVRRVLLALCFATYWIGTLSLALMGSADSLELALGWLYYIVPVQLLVSLLQLLAIRGRSGATSLSRRCSIAYFMAFPFYEVLKSTLAVDAVRASILGRNLWQVTPRET